MKRKDVRRRWPPRPAGCRWRTPEEHYVTGDDDQTQAEVARVWGRSRRVIERWAVGYHWSEKRQQYREESENRARAAALDEDVRISKEINAELTRMRREAPRDEARIAKALQVEIVRRIQGGGMSIQDLQRLASALGNVVTVQRAALGLDAAGVSGEPPVSAEELEQRLRKLVGPEDEKPDGNG